MSRSLTRREITKILKEAQCGNITRIEILKNENPKFHWSNLKYENTGDTILHCAARLGQVETVKFLLSFVPSGVDCRNNDDKTALHEAAQFSQHRVVEFLLENGAEVNALKRADWTPLMLACTKKCPKTVQILVENGGLINYQNKDGWTCVHLAAREGSSEIFKFLIQGGGDCRMRTKNGRHVLHIAALHGNLNIAQFLLSEKLIEDINVKDNCGNTPLHEAVLGRNINFCRFVIQNGADKDSRNKVDFSILLLAASEGYDDLIEFIVEELSFDINLVNESGFSALHCAARKGHVKTCEYLIRLGCNKDVKDKFSRVAFDYLK